MSNPKPVVAPQEPKERNFSLHWSEAPDLPLVLADEAVIQFTGDRVYITVGQVQMPPNLALERPTGLEIAPVARLVFTTEAYHKLAKAMNGVSDEIRKIPPKESTR